MADNVNITPGSGAAVTTEQVSDSSECQLVKLAISTAASRTKIPADATNGLLVQISGAATALVVNNPTAANLKVDASGVAVPVTDNSGSITVDAPVGTPVFVRLSDGSSAISTLPVSGTVTANQGTPAVVANAHPIKISDGTDTVGISTVSAAKALKVDVIQSVGAGVSATDETTFTETSSAFAPVGGVYNDSAASPSSGQQAAARITSKRAVHVNLRSNGGTELGTSGNPVRNDPTGSTNQPVTQAVANWTVDLNKVGGDSVAKVGTGIQKVAIVDSLGTAFSNSAAVPTAHRGESETRVSKTVSVAASQTGATVWTPSSGKTLYIRKIILNVSVTGTLTLFDSTNASGNIVFDGTFPTGVFVMDFDHPFASAAINNVLKYTSGSGMTASISLHGYEV